MSFVIYTWYMIFCSYLNLKDFNINYFFPVSIDKSGLHSVIFSNTVASRVSSYKNNKSFSIDCKVSHACFIINQKEKCLLILCSLRDHSSLGYWTSFRDTALTARDLKYPCSFSKISIFLSFFFLPEALIHYKSR